MHHITIKAVRQPGRSWQFETDVNVDGLDYAEIANGLGSLAAMLNRMGQTLAAKSGDPVAFNARVAEAKDATAKMFEGV